MKLKLGATVDGLSSQAALYTTQFVFDCNDAQFTITPVPNFSVQTGQQKT